MLSLTEGQRKIIFKLFTAFGTGKKTPIIIKTMSGKLYVCILYTDRLMLNTFFTSAPFLFVFTLVLGLRFRIRSFDISFISPGGGRFLWTGR